MLSPGSMRSESSMSIHDSARHLYLGTLLQFALRTVIIGFVTVTLLWEPPNRHEWACFALLAVSVVVVGSWSGWALRPASRMAPAARTRVTLLVLTADVAVLSIISV